MKLSGYEDKINRLTEELRVLQDCPFTDDHLYRIREVEVDLVLTKKQRDFCKAYNSLWNMDANIVYCNGPSPKLALNNGTSFCCEAGFHVDDAAENEIPKRTFPYQNWTTCPYCGGATTYVTGHYENTDTGT